MQADSPLYGVRDNLAHIFWTGRPLGCYREGSPRGGITVGEHAPIHDGMEEVGTQHRPGRGTAGT